MFIIVTGWVLPYPIFILFPHQLVFFSTHQQQLHETRNNLTLHHFTTNFTSEQICELPYPISSTKIFTRFVCSTHQQQLPPVKLALTKKR